jgi:hypothetical protein
MSMFRVNLTRIQTAVATRLPKIFEPLTLTFYGLATRQKGDFITIGSDGFVDLCVNARDGRVYAKDPSGKLADRFVNSGFEQFISFFKTYADCADQLAQCSSRLDYHSSSGTRIGASALRPALEAIDKDALGDSGRYWEPAVQQFEEENAKPAGGITGPAGPAA